MIDFPIAELLDDSICLIWLERHLHPDWLTGSHCGSPKRRLFRRQGHFSAYRCRDCEAYYPLLRGAIFEKTHQRPATLVQLLRGIAKGESPAWDVSWASHANRSIPFYAGPSDAARNPGNGSRNCGSCLGMGRTSRGNNGLMERRDG
jgi:hypothetical protein